MGKSVLRDKSYVFSIRIVRLMQYLQCERKEYVLSKQILRSGTSIGANVKEAEFGQSNSDFIHKMSIALKEANETDYWLNILHDTHYIDKKMFVSMQSDCKELIAMLVASIKTLKRVKSEGS